MDTHWGASECVRPVNNSSKFTSIPSVLKQIILIDFADLETALACESVCADFRRVVKESVLKNQPVQQNKPVIKGEKVLSKHSVRLSKRYAVLRNHRSKFDECVERTESRECSEQERRRNSSLSSFSSASIVSRCDRRSICEWVDSWEDVYQKTVCGLDVPDCEGKLSFKEFVLVADNLFELRARRSEEIKNLFVFIDSTHTHDPLSDTDFHHALTKQGNALVATVFDFFDKDEDGALNASELACLNSAAGIPLTPPALLWVRTHYPTRERDGALTRRGYKQMFLENCVRVPHLMHRDLEKIARFMHRAGLKPSLTSIIYGDRE